MRYGAALLLARSFALPAFVLGTAAGRGLALLCSADGYGVLALSHNRAYGTPQVATLCTRLSPDLPSCCLSFRLRHTCGWWQPAGTQRVAGASLRLAAYIQHARERVWPQLRDVSWSGHWTMVSTVIGSQQIEATSHIPWPSLLVMSIPTQLTQHKAKYAA
jgi:hypothetical protein